MPAVIFDLDGTLVDSAPDIHAGVSALLAREGAPPLSFDAVRGMIGGGVPVLIDRVARAAGLALDPARQQDRCDWFTERYEQATDGLTRAYDGVDAALDRLQAAGVTLGLCTNKPTGPTRALLRAFGWQDRFASVICGDTLAVRKPDPAPLRLAVETLGQPALFVGDSEVDAETAHRADVPLILFTQGYRKTPLALLPHAAAFDRWDDLPLLAARLMPA
ncbi:MAG: phosphoglycolate phosphatase [Pseudomonadota bacterium]|jgi:phosphoglycolate phosphatase